MKGNKSKKTTGRPQAKWKTKANAERIFEWMREGKSLRQICKANNWPLTTVNQWLTGEFSEQYAEAREARADYFFDEIAEIADEPMADKVDVMRAKLRIDTRKWIMGRMNPKKYSENVKVDLSGETKVVHDGSVELTPNDMAIQQLNEIIGQAIQQGKIGCVEDTGEE